MRDARNDIMQHGGHANEVLLCCHVSGNDNEWLSSMRRLLSDDIVVYGLSREECQRSLVVVLRGSCADGPPRRPCRGTLALFAPRHGEREHHEMWEQSNASDGHKGIAVSPRPALHEGATGTSASRHVFVCSCSQAAAQLAFGSTVDRVLMGREPAGDGCSRRVRRRLGRPCRRVLASMSGTWPRRGRSWITRPEGS